MTHKTYHSPLESRYASDEMLALWGDDKKFQTWRRLWIELAKAEQSLGLPVTDAQIAEMEAHATDIDYERAAHHEKQLRHDVMAHIHAWGEQCPSAMPIIHLGATSCYVGDNTDILLLKEGLQLIRARLLDVLAVMRTQARAWKDQPTLGFTHFQPAQPTTVGKRITLWMQDFLSDLEELDFRLSTLKLRGVKGTTGTQASFLELFRGEHDKVKKLEQRVTEALGFSYPNGVCAVTGQTYSRKTDAAVLATLAGIAQSAAKFATDFRLLSHLKEMEEPFESAQIGSSAMPYKRNPMRTERICALARVVQNLAPIAGQTASTQWFERTLDDSAARRIVLPEAFLAVDAILLIVRNVAVGWKVYPNVIEQHLAAELPFMATENIMMDAVSRGGNRQELHERIRVHAIAAGRLVKEEGKPNDLCARIAKDDKFGLTFEEICGKLNPSLYIGRAPQQTEDFIGQCVDPVLEGYVDGDAGELKV